MTKQSPAQNARTAAALLRQMSKQGGSMIRISETANEDRGELLRSIGNFRFRLRQCRAARCPLLWWILHGFAAGVASTAEHGSRLAKLADGVCDYAAQQAESCERGVKLRVAE